ncbi:hypothetical protein ACFSHT_04170 [Paraburkholderia silviterrae]|uniref:Uncharacterized protein n=1 Tax=Paraburkholderia silviterrae TaxID=2528715 RepID=A0A4V2ZYE0_9BURK|nr:hypothetical protein [Paraburkholderia silviterrae]TDG20004.1 hypothetical protein EYW47_27990 [Paraburkholderia silviterrae]
MRIQKLIVTLLLIPFCAGAQPASQPKDRDHSVLDAFQVMCNLELPVFSHVDAKATAMHMHLQGDTSAPGTNGSVTRHKMWVGGLTTGPFALLLDEMDGTKGVATSCAVAAQVPDVDGFRTALIDGMKLPPATPQTDQSGARTSEWHGISGPGTTLILRSIIKGETSSVMVKMIAMRPQQ